jgi:hypothetical protein
MSIVASRTRTQFQRSSDSIGSMNFSGADDTSTGRHSRERETHYRLVAREVEIHDAADAELHAPVHQDFITARQILCDFADIRKRDHLLDGTRRVARHPSKADEQAAFGPPSATDLP